MQTLGKQYNSNSNSINPFHHIIEIRKVNNFSQGLTTTRTVTQFSRQCMFSTISRHCMFSTISRHCMFSTISRHCMFTVQYNLRGHNIVEGFACLQTAGVLVIVSRDVSSTSSQCAGDNYLTMYKARRYLYVSISVTILLTPRHHL